MSVTMIPIKPFHRHNKLRLMLQTWRERFRDPLLTVLTIVLVLLMFVVAPLRAAGIVSDQEIPLSLSLLVIAIVLVQSGSRPVVVFLVIALVLVVVGAVLRHQHDLVGDIYFKASAWAIAGIALSWVVGRRVFSPGRITYHRIVGAILLYLTIGLTFVALYTFVGVLLPGSFSGMSVKDSPALGSTMIYFSFGTLTTVGSGTIAPLHPIVRSLCIIESMIGQLYPATLLARLVTLEIRDES